MWGEDARRLKFQTGDGRVRMTDQGISLIRIIQLWIKKQQLSPLSTHDVSLDLESKKSWCETWESFMPL